MRNIIILSICLLAVSGCVLSNTTTKQVQDDAFNQTIIDSISKRLYFLTADFVKDDYFEQQQGKTEYIRVASQRAIVQAVYRTYPNGLYKEPITLFLKGNQDILDFKPALCVDDKSKLSPAAMWVGNIYLKDSTISNVLKISQITTEEKVISIIDVYVLLPRHLYMRYDGSITTNIETDFHELFMTGELIKNMDDFHKKGFIKNLNNKGYNIPAQTDSSIVHKTRDEKSDSMLKYCKRVLIKPSFK